MFTFFFSKKNVTNFSNYFFNLQKTSKKTKFFINPLQNTTEKPKKITIFFLFSIKNQTFMRRFVYTKLFFSKK